MLQDMTMAAFNEAAKKVDEEARGKNGRHAGRNGPAAGNVLSMPDYAEPLARLILEFKHLPGIGQKSAMRLRSTCCALRAPTPSAWRKRYST